MPALYHEEAIKAQAVAAYTFACYRKSADTNKEYDISADPETAQCFITREEAAAKWGEKADEYSEKIEKCIDAVEGQLLTYDKAPIFAAYTRYLQAPQMRVQMYGVRPTLSARNRQYW